MHPFRTLIRVSGAALSRTEGSEAQWGVLNTASTVVMII